MEAALKKLRSELPLKSEIIFNGVSQKIHANEDQVLPAEHATTFTNYPLASKEQVSAAIESALKAKKDWQNTPFVDRAAIFQRAAELATTKYRYELIASTMLGQGKNVWQGEIDAAAELADFFRLAGHYAAEIMSQQPQRGTDGIWTRIDYRPLEGFIYAVSPFNFSAIGGNLIAPAILGNVVLWKPSLKLIGATSHYVTADLDEGPIIEQDIVRVTHAQSADDYVSLGRDVESQVLARAIHAHIHGRVFINGNKTIVFPPSPGSFVSERMG